MLSICVLGLIGAVIPGYRMIFLPSPIIPPSYFFMISKADIRCGMHYAKTAAPEGAAVLPCSSIWFVGFHTLYIDVD